jgi:hypothetical protein
MVMMKVSSTRLSLKGTSTIYMGSIPPVPPWSRDSAYVYFAWFSAFNSTFRRPLLGRFPRFSVKLVVLDLECSSGRSIEEQSILSNYS